MSEISFEENLEYLIKQSVINQIKKAEFVKFEYAQRQPLPQVVIEKLWKSIDWNEVIERVRPEFEKRLCNAIIGNMETEIKTDVKSILSIDGVRQKLRAEVYPNIMKILDKSE